MSNLHDVISFINSQKCKFIAIEGFCSTGKTTLTKEIIRTEKEFGIIELDNYREQASSPDYQLSDQDTKQFELKARELERSCAKVLIDGISSSLLLEKIGMTHKTDYSIVWVKDSTYKPSEELESVLRNNRSAPESQIDIYHRDKNMIMSFSKFKILKKIQFTYDSRAENKTANKN